MKDALTTPVLMTEQECLAAIAGGETARDLLLDAIPTASRRFKAVDKALRALLTDVRVHFPDAEYYTASGGFNLMIGHSHNASHVGQQELIALCGNASIGDGDF